MIRPLFLPPHLKCFEIDIHPYLLRFSKIFSGIAMDVFQQIFWWPQTWWPQEVGPEIWYDVDRIPSTHFWGLTGYGRHRHRTSRAETGLDYPRGIIDIERHKTKSGSSGG